MDTNNDSSIYFLGAKLHNDPFPNFNDIMEVHGNTIGEFPGNGKWNKDIRVKDLLSHTLLLQC